MEIGTLEFPKKWVLAKIGDLVLNPKNEIVDGPFGSNLKASEYVDKGIPVIRLQNIKRNLFIKKNIRFITAEKAKTLTRHNFSKGDIVITKLGDPLGEACIIPDEIDNGIIVADIVRVRIDHKYISKKYLVYSLNSDFAIKQFETKTKGTTRPRVNLNHIRDLELFIPPLPEQHRIVEKIEELFTKLDAGIEALKKVKAQLKRYRQAVLKYAFEGKLTQEWREANKDKLEPASVLLEKIKEERKKKARGKFKESPPVDTADLPKLPKGWEWTNVASVGEVVTGTTPSKAKKEFYSKDYPFYKPTDLNDGYYVRKSEDGLSKEGISKARLLPAKSILVTSIGATIGKTGFIRESGASNQQINAIVAEKGILPEYIYFVCISPPFQTAILDNASATTLPILNKSKFELLAIPIAPFNEQQKIVEEIDSRLSIADEIEKMADQTLRQSARLRQSILKTAFEGKLILQDPTDEPAEKLLERIKAEKAKKESGTKSRRKRSN